MAIGGITAAFANLNRSIRGVREDKYRHDERMQQLDLQQKQLENELNDPRRKLAMKQAQIQLMPEQVVSPFAGKDMSPTETEQFNAYDRKAIESVLRSDWEYTDDHKIVNKATGEPVMLPKFQADELRSKLSVASYASRLGNTQMDLDMQKLRKDISDKEKGLKKVGRESVQGKIYSSILKLKKQELAEMEKEYASPKHEFQRLMSANKKLNKIFQEVATQPYAKDLMPALTNAHQMNVNQLEMLVKAEAAQNKGLGKNTAFVSYEYTDPDTEKTHTIKQVVPKALYNNAPTEILYNGKTYKRGATTGGKTDKEDKSMPTTDVQIRSVEKDVGVLRNLLATSDETLSDEDYIKSMVKDMPPEVQALMMSGDIRNIRRNTANALDWYDSRYGKEKWYSGNPKNVEASARTLFEQLLSEGKDKAEAEEEVRKRYYYNK